MFPTQVQEQEKQEFSESIDTYDDKLTFSDLNIARPLMKVGNSSAVLSLPLLVFSLSVIEKQACVFQISKNRHRQTAVSCSRTNPRRKSLVHEVH